MYSFLYGPRDYPNSQYVNWDTQHNCIPTRLVYLDALMDAVVTVKNTNLRDDISIARAINKLVNLEYVELDRFTRAPERIIVDLDSLFFSNMMRDIIRGLKNVDHEDPESTLEGNTRRRPNYSRVPRVCNERFKFVAALKTLMQVFRDVIHAVRTDAPLPYALGFFDRTHFEERFSLNWVTHTRFRCPFHDCYLYHY